MKAFKIPVVPITTPKTIRFPNNIIDEIEEAIRGQECTFSDFVREAVKNALEELG